MRRDHPPLYIDFGECMSTPVVTTRPEEDISSNTEIADKFGEGLALSDDTLVVGAVEEDSGAMGINGNQADNSVVNSGAVCIYRAQ